MLAEGSITPLSVDDQKAGNFECYDLLPFNHYCRKNIGYIQALRDGSEIIFDTDDDNAPLDGAEKFWSTIIDGELKEATYQVSRSADQDTPTINIYSHFSDQMLWPRGLPMETVQTKGALSDTAENDVSDILVWQGLVNGDPDVDAIHRLIFGVDSSFKFKDHPPIVLKNGTYCPFNSQNTLWFKPAFPLLYLPSSVTFRYTDILRGFVAQRCLHAMNARLAFTKATAFQDRNMHDYYKDMQDEIPCYLTATKTISTLESTECVGKPEEDILSCYKALEAEEIVTTHEIKRLTAYLNDLTSALDNI